MLFSRGGKNAFAAGLALVLTVAAVAASWFAPPWAPTAPIPLSAASLNEPSYSASSSWTGFSPTAWVSSQSVTATVTVSDPFGLNQASGEYRYSTTGSITSAAWTNTSLTVSSPTLTSMNLVVSGLSLVDSAALDQVQFRVLDSLGGTNLSPIYTVQVDSAQPSSAVVIPSAGQIISSTAEVISGTALDTTSGVQQVELSISGEVWLTAVGSTQWTYTWNVPSTDGASYSLRSRATDQAGNVEIPGEGVTVTVDNVAPSSTVTAPSSGEQLSGTVYSVRGIASDGSGVARVEVSIDGGAWESATGTTSWSYSWPLQSYGTYTIRSRAIDLAGNVETPSGGVTATVDNRVPTSSITDPTNGSLLSGSTRTIRGTASEGVAQVEVSVDDGPWSAATGTVAWQYGWTLPGDGSHNVRSRARDSLGRLEMPREGITVTVDNTRPSSEIIAPLLGQVVSGTALIVAGTSSDVNGVGAVEVRLGGGNWIRASGTDNWTYSWSISTTDGTRYVLQSRAIDRVGNVEVPRPGVTIIVDNVPPSSSVLAPAHGQVLTGATYLVRGQASDGLGVTSVQLSIDGGTWVDVDGTLNWSYLWTMPGEGAHTLRSRAVDAAGNVSTDGVAITAVVDRSGPSVTITSPSAGQIISGSTFPVQGTASDPNGVAYVQVQVDDGIWSGAVGSSNWLYSWSLPVDGVHSLRGRGADFSGNVGPISPNVAVIVDNTPPTVTISYPASGAIVTGTSQMIKGVAADATSGVAEVRVSTDGGVSWYAATGVDSWEHQWGAAGEDGVAHVVAAVAADKGGNLGQSLTRTVVVDNVPPIASVEPLPPTLSATSISVAWSGRDGLGVQAYDVQVKVDDGGWTPWILNTVATAAIFEGRGGHSYSFRVRAQDMAGNWGDFVQNADVTVSIPIFRVSMPILFKPPAFQLSRMEVDRSAANGGDDLVYSIHVNNSAFQSATAVVRGTIPANTVYVADSATGGLAYDGSAMTWSGSVPPSGSRKLTFRVKVNDEFSGVAVGESTVDGGGGRLALSTSTYVLVANGRFDNGSLNGWQTDGVLPVSAALEAGRTGRGLLLGFPGFRCEGSVPVGAGEIFQTIKVPNSGAPTLSFWFRLFSEDVDFSPKFGSYGDTLDVSVRDAGGGAQPLLRFGAPYREVGCGRAPYDSGWQRRSFDLSAFKGQQIQLNFALWNRIDGWYNSWAYLDEVRID